MLRFLQPALTRAVRTSRTASIISSSARCAHTGALSRRSISTTTARFNAKDDASSPADGSSADDKAQARQAVLDRFASLRREHSIPEVDDQNLFRAEVNDKTPLELDDPFIVDETIELIDSDQTPVDNKWTFNDVELDPETGLEKTIVVDRHGERLRGPDDYNGEVREEDQEFAGYTVMIRQRDKVAEDMEGVKSTHESQDSEEPQGQDLEYDVEHDPEHHWRDRSVLESGSEREGEEEYLIAPTSTYGTKGGGQSRSYLIGGEEMPPTIWQGREWLTFPRTWEDIRENGATPSDEEIDNHLKTILGDPRPDIPVSPPRQPKPQEYIWASIEGQDPEDLLLDDKEWKQKSLKQISPRTWFMEARIRYKTKLNLVRSKYLKEYKHVKALHDANILARWDQQMMNRSRRVELRVRRQEESWIKTLAQDKRMAERRAKIRIKSRFTRMNKEMKQRRLNLHIFNYILRERELHWIQPKIEASTGEIVHNKNLTTKLFEKDNFVVGFWPKHPAEERQERLDEIFRRKAAKEATRASR